MRPPISESDHISYSVDIFDVTSVLIALAASTVVSILLLAIEVLHQHMGLKISCNCYPKLCSLKYRPLKKKNERRAQSVIIQAYEM
jgi:hypothetical protein